MSDAYTDRLSEYLDGELTGAERAELETHLAACDECARTLAELRGVVARARALPDRQPARDMWPEIAAGIGAAPAEGPRVLDIRHARARGARRLSFTVPQLAAAAVVLMLLSSGAAWLLSGRGPAPAGPVPVASAPQAQAPVLTASAEAAADLDQAVADLRQVVEAGRSSLDPATIQAIDTNLRIVDNAIAEARAAVERDPNSEYLNAYLAESMRRKLSLVRQSTAVLRATT